MRMGAALLRAGDLPEAKKMFQKGIKVKVRQFLNGETNVGIVFIGIVARRSSAAPRTKSSWAEYFVYKYNTLQVEMCPAVPIINTFSSKDERDFVYSSLCVQRRMVLGNGKRSMGTSRV